MLSIKHVTLTAAVAALAIGFGALSVHAPWGSNAVYAANGGQNGDNSVDHGVGGSGGKDGNGGGGGRDGGGGGGGAPGGQGGSDGTDSSGGASGRG